MIHNKNTILPANIQSSQRQRSAIRRSNVLSIKPKDLVLDETQANNYTPKIVRRQRLSTDNFSQNQSITDADHNHGNQSTLNLPIINKPLQKLLTHSKTIHENRMKSATFNLKLANTSATSIGMPPLYEKPLPSTRTQNSNAQALRHFNSLHYPLSTEKNHSNPKHTLAPDFYIQAKPIKYDVEKLKKSNIFDSTNEYYQSTSNIAIMSEDDQINDIDSDSPEIDNAENDLFSSSIFIPEDYSPKKSRKRKCRYNQYSTHLPPLNEHLCDNDK